MDEGLKTAPFKVADRNTTAVVFINPHGRVSEAPPTACFGLRTPSMMLLTPASILASVVDITLEKRTPLREMDSSH